MHVSELKGKIQAEVNRLEYQLERKRLILESYVGDKTKLIRERENWILEMETWKKCLDLVNQLDH
ncbi:hypothetical protein K4A83_09065 [Spirulina subsalsa FACHB-351]|uniref:Uncharacterized protein n=2 Tax=Spirulina subsalsa TaxID=54311 RepID=A0ABT3L4I9_9CYAN|nr:hypothetical protein [Spirulina subsalsa]MCW6036418.1 hypothetical protein [Spirulina subsalsa FACHB-351]